MRAVMAGAAAAQSMGVMLTKEGAPPPVEGLLRVALSTAGPPPPIQAALSNPPSEWPKRWRWPAWPPRAESAVWVAAMARLSIVFWLVSPKMFERLNWG